MFNNLADSRNPQSLAAQLRRKRLRLFFSLLARLENPIQILDVGGTEDLWRLAGLPAGKETRITVLNLDRVPTTLPNITSIAGDARDLRFPDASFDVVFSNSVIEHVGGPEDQRKMANEVRRVGKRHFVQTPNKFFLIEPHFIFPFYQFLPRKLQIWLLQNFRLGWISRIADRAEAERLIASIHLLDKSEFKSLFPDSQIFEEKFLGLTKSFVAYAGWNS